MIYSNLAERVLFPAVKSGANRLCVLTESAAPNMVSWLLLNHMKRLKAPVKLELIIDAEATNGISVSLHESFKELHSIVPDFICSYVCEPISSSLNLYIWLRDDTPVSAFTTSAAFEQSAFLEKERGDIAVCDARNAFEQYTSAESNSIYCHHAEIEEHVRIFQAPASGDQSGVSGDHSALPRDEITLSLVTKRTGEPGIRSGLNWGQRKGRNPNQAYIPLPIGIARSGFFPIDPIDSPPHFTVLTDDRHQLILRIEQQNHKAIATPLSNAQLGEYFRGRLGLPNGAYVNKADLERYGRTDVKFLKIDSEHYYMDFSV